jgi:hypothetical protein
MKHLSRAFLPFAVLLCATFIAAPATAQISCYECDAQSTACSTPCWWCQIDYPDNYCPQQYYNETTCGDYGAGCMQDNCTPNWVVTSRVNQGTYGDGDFWACSHHKVDKVTETDTNHCSTASWGWTRVWCDDYVDGQKFAWPSWPDCCDGSPGFSCNHYHHCY